MRTIPKDLQRIIEFFERLPGIGPKSAKRLGFYLLRIPQEDLDEVSASIANLKKNTRYCRTCFNLTSDEVCPICVDMVRDKRTIVVVEDVLDLLSFESGTQYQGLYHVLHGRIDPVNYIGPEDIYIPQLLHRIERDITMIDEVIIATNPNTEGDATAMYIKSQLEEIIRDKGHRFSITRLAYGLPIGAHLEYTDYMTLKQAISNRKSL